MDIDTFSHITNLPFEALLKELYQKGFSWHYIERESTNGKHFLNPANQEFFNCGVVTIKDLQDWLVGSGPIVKGKTQKEKQFVIEVFEFERKIHNAWHLRLMYDFFHLIPESKPLFTLNRKNADLIITNCLWEIKQMYLRELESELSFDESFIERGCRLSQETTTKLNDVRYGMLKTLTSMGLCKYEAINTPCIIQNAAWAAELAESKALYEFLVLQDIQVPNYKKFSRITNRR